MVKGSDLAATFLRGRLNIESCQSIVFFRLAMHIECVPAVFQEVLKTDLETLITDGQFQHFLGNEIRGTFIWN